MKINHINVNNFLRIQEFDGEIAPLTLFAGANGAGKSSLRDAIIFAVTGDPGRAGKQTKTSKELLHRGADGGAVTVQFDDGKSVSRDVVTGAVLGQRYDYPVALPFVLKADEFCKDTTDRRSALFSIMGLSAGAEEIMKRLAEKNIDPGVIGEVKHLLAGGCAPALTDAEKKRTLAKGAWCEVTGARQYGKNIAEGWKAELTGPSIEELTAKYGSWDEIQTDLVAWNNIIARQNQLIGEFNAYQEAQAKLPGLREKAKTHAVEAAALKKLQAQHKALQEELDKIPVPGKPAQSTMPGMGAAAQEKVNPALVLECPGCKTPLMYKVGKLVHAPKVAEAAPAKVETKAKAAEPDPQDAENKARREGLKQDMEAVSALITAAERKVKEADVAAGMLDGLEKATLRQELSDAPAQLEDAEQGLKECQQAEQEMKAAMDAAGQAETRTARAKALHVTVQKWEALVTALSPDGIPAEILKDAMGPLNEQLQAAADATGWPLTSLDENMNVFVGDFPRKLSSESYIWRGDAMMAVSLAVVSNVRVVSLDRLDVLDMPSRGVLLNWLVGLIDANVIDTVILFGTLKAPPDLGEGTKTYWLE